MTKLVLYGFWNTPLLTVQKQDAWHHMYTGLIIIFISRFFPSKTARILLAIGVGLFLDEIVHTVHMLGLTSAVDYWSLESIAVTFFGYLAVCSIVLMFTKKN